MEEKGTLLPAAIPGGLSRLRTSPPFDVVFLDPPYGKGLVQATLLALTTMEVLVPGALIFAEAGRGEEIPAIIGDFQRMDQRTYGTTVIHLYSYSMAEGQAT
jgi:16S rRNA G966 N2-methylase RsmD